MSIFRITFFSAMFLTCVASANEPSKAEIGTNKEVLKQATTPSQGNDNSIIEHSGMEEGITRTPQSSRTLQALDFDFKFFDTLSEEQDVVMFSGELDHSFSLGYFEPFYRVSLARLSLGGTTYIDGFGSDIYEESPLDELVDPSEESGRVGTTDTIESIKMWGLVFGFGIGFDLNMINILETKRDGIFTPYLGLSITYNIIRFGVDVDSYSNTGPSGESSSGISMFITGAELGGKYFFTERLAIKLALNYDRVVHAFLTGDGVKHDLTDDDFGDANTSFGIKSGIIFYF